MKPDRTGPRVEHTVATLDLRGCPTGPVLAPLGPRGDLERAIPGDWDTPLAPHGGYHRPSGLEVVAEEGAARPALAFTLENHDRALLSGSPEARDYRVRARVLPLDAEAHPDSDRE